MYRQPNKATLSVLIRTIGTRSNPKSLLRRSTYNKLTTPSCILFNKQYSSRVTTGLQDKRFYTAVTTAGPADYKAAMASATITTKTLNHGIRALVAGPTDSPKAPILICLPGWPQTAEAFLPIIPQLTKAGYRIYSLDPPGLGDSSPPPKDDYTMHSISSIIHSAIISEIGESTPFHIISHDIGVWIAVMWALQHPQNIRSVSLFDAAVPGLASPMAFPPPKAANFKIFQFSFNQLPELPEILTAGRERQFLDWLFDNKAVHPQKITEEMRKLYSDKYSAPGAMSRGFAYYRCYEENVEHFKEVLNGEGKKLEMPVLAMGSEVGIGMGLKMSVADLGAKVEGGVIENCGHYAIEERPEEVARMIGEFVARAEGKV